MEFFNYKSFIISLELLLSLSINESLKSIRESKYLLQKKVVLIEPGMSSKKYTFLAVIIELVEPS